METAKMNVESVEMGKQGAFAHFLNSCKRKIADIFEPEEVVVNCEEDHGTVISYTYTVVEHKEVA